MKRSKMMKIKHIICATTVLCCVTTPAMSQVDKEVEVTQAFVPQVMPATKPAILPDMTDEAYINPDIDYSITPISIHTEIDTTPYKPVEMDYWEYSRQKNYYAKLGFGLPLSSVADLYTTKSNSRGYKIGYVNYEGNYADIKNDYGVKSDAAQSHLRAGFGAGVYVGKRVLEGRFDYTNDKWSRYATSVLNDEHPLYQSVGLDLRFGDNFSDLSRWNYSLCGGVEQMWSRSNYENTTLNASGDFGRQIGEMKLIFSAAYRYVGGSNDYRSNTIGGSILLGFKGENSKFDLGMDYYHDEIAFGSGASNVAYSIDGGLKNYYIPNVNFEYQLSSTKAMAYFTFDGDLLYNDFASLSSRNPYIAAGLFGVTSSVDYGVNLGLKGTIADKRLGYNISGYYSWAVNKLFWALNESSITSSTYVDNSFAASLSNQESIGMVVQSEYRPNSKFRFDFEGVWANYYENDDQPWADGESNLELRLGGEYRVKALRVGVDCEVLSSRLCSVISSKSYGSSSLYTVKIPTTVDLGFNVDYTLKSDMVIFCELNNLLNDDLYEWVRYRDWGVGGLVGVRFEF